MHFTLVPEDRLETLRAALCRERDALAPGERLHAAILPAEEFF